MACQKCQEKAKAAAEQAAATAIVYLIHPQGKQFPFTAPKALAIMQSDGQGGGWKWACPDDCGKEKQPIDAATSGQNTGDPDHQADQEPAGNRRSGKARK